MPQIYTAFASEAKVNGETIEGLQSIEYRQVKNRSDVGAVGTDERIAVYFGLRVVLGQMTIASANSTLDQLLDTNEEFSITVMLKHGETTRSVTFDACYLDDKAFSMATTSHGSTVYSFSATRVREE